jgi:hypothetical protein
MKFGFNSTMVYTVSTIGTAMVEVLRSLALLNAMYLFLLLLMVCLVYHGAPVFTLTFMQPMYMDSRHNL